MTERPTKILETTSDIYYSDSEQNRKFHPKNNNGPRKGKTVNQIYVEKSGLHPHCSVGRITNSLTIAGNRRMLHKLLNMC